MNDDDGDWRDLFNKRTGQPRTKGPDRVAAEDRVRQLYIQFENEMGELMQKLTDAKIKFEGGGNADHRTVSINKKALTVRLDLDADPSPRIVIEETGVDEQEIAWEVFHNSFTVDAAPIPRGVETTLGFRIRQYLKDALPQ